jgi:hypothetical protein
MSPRERAEIRLDEAIVELRDAAAALGIDAVALAEREAPWQLRADAWCWRAERDLQATRRILERAA